MTDIKPLGDGENLERNPDKEFFTSPLLYVALGAATLLTFFGSGRNGNSSYVDSNYTESVPVDSIPSNRLEEIVSVEIPANELEIFRNQYMVDGRLDPTDLSYMAGYFFKHNVKDIVGLGPAFSPDGADFRVKKMGDYEATIEWEGNDYTFCLEEDWSGAELYKN